MPSFDLSDSGGLGLVLLRGLVDIAVLMAFGMAVFRAVVVPAARPHAPAPQVRATEASLRQLNAGIALFAVLLLIAWLFFVSRSLADATRWADSWTAVVLVVTGTSFGLTLLWEAGALVLSCLFLCVRNTIADWLALIFSGIAVILQACHGHAFSMGNTGLFLCTALHLLAAGAWLGGLPAFAWMVAQAPPPVAQALSRRFSPLGMVCVVVVAVTAWLQGVVMVQSFGTLVSTAYGWIALLKLLLFVALLMLAGFNRYGATPRLDRPEAAGTARAMLLRSLCIETAISLAVILAAGLLASLPPVMRM